MVTIPYSDGLTTERRILALIEEASKIGSESAIGSEEYNSWPVRYHLSPERANLVRHLDFRGLDVLEIGAGMGAVSRFLAEQAKTLTIVEGTELRFQAASARLRDLSNWTGHVGNLEDVVISQKFDAVCVIGVMEYAPLFISAPTPLESIKKFLDLTSSFLKPEGTLIVAIENKLGLKYWAGAPEDHTGAVFDSVCGYPPTKTARVLSRGELKELLGSRGFAKIDEFYPYPDYKLPKTILSNEFVSDAADVACGMVSSTCSPSHGQPRSAFFPELLALESLATAGLMSDFANSFLFLASGSSNVRVREQLLRNSLQKRELAWHYSNSRKVPVKTIFCKQLEGNYLVSKTPLLVETAAPVSPKFLWLKSEGARIAAGRPLRNHLVRLAYFAKWEEFLDELTRFLNWVFDTWKVSHPDRLNGAALDAIFSNINMLDQHGYEFFDSEWVAESDIDKSWFVFRNVLYLSSERPLFSEQTSFRSLADLYSELCLRVGVEPQLEKAIALEFAFQSEVASPAPDYLSILKKLTWEEFENLPFVREPGYEQRSFADRKKLEHLSEELKSSQEQLKSEIKSLYAERQSWSLERETLAIQIAFRFREVSSRFPRLKSILIKILTPLVR